MFGQSAIQKGYLDNDFINALNSQSKAIEDIDKDIENLDKFCEIENELSMIRKRTRILKVVGITLEQFNNNDFGNVVLTKRRKRAIKKAQNIGFGFLTSDWLLADLDDENERNTKRISVKKYVAKEDTKNMLTKVFVGLVGGYYVLDPFSSANWNIIIWRVFFFTIMLIFGYVRYITDYNFITHDYRKMILSKTNYLIKFKTSLENHKDWYIEKIPEEALEPIKEQNNEVDEKEERYLGYTQESMNI